jgi:hypothetical protein
MTKTLNQIFFPPPISEYFFQQHWVSEYFFRKKNHKPPSPTFKLNGRSLKQQWTIEEISIFCNSSHLEWRMGLSDTILKGDHPRTILVKFALIWFSVFRGEDLNVIFYQNMPNLHNRHKSADRKISSKTRNIC